MDAYDKKAFYAGAATMDWLVVLAMAASMAKGLSGAGSTGGGGFGGRLVTPDGMTIGAPAIAGEGVLAPAPGIGSGDRLCGHHQWDG